MDESYLEWLIGLPGFGEAKARRVAERFPSLEQLRAATREELTSVPGVTSADLETLLGLLSDGSERDASGELFLCPECGSFVGTAAKSCPFCGVEFDASVDSGLSEQIDDFVAEEDAPARICLTCGAGMGIDAMKCGMCGRQYTPEELALLPGFQPALDESSPFCPRCGGYLFSDETECAICGTAVTSPKPTAPTANAKGVVKDFLTRWQRMAQAVPALSEADRLQEELEHYDRLIEADGTLERAWVNRARILEKLGRPAEAADSLSKAADLNPTKDDEYRLEVQNILRSTADASALPARWRQPAATAAPKVVDTRLVEALSHYDSLLRADPSLVVAWRTKGEILDRLGRPDEARDCFDRADRLERAEGRSLQAAVSGLRSRGLATSGPAGGGHVNGRVNGTRSGRTNGRTNGRVNGLAEGRVNGLTTGAVNGLTFGKGATNGLVNGNGFTNGRRGRYGPPRIPAQPHWSRSVVGIAAVVALMVIVPILASMLSPSPSGPSPIIRIDGDFSDWAKFPTYSVNPTGAIQNPAVNLQAIKVAAEDQDLFVYARVQGQLFQGVAVNETDSMFVFLDRDNNRLTGYPIGDLGADAMVEVTGWQDYRGLQHQVTSYLFDESVTPRSNDWNRFRPGGSAEAAFSGSQLELRTSVSNPGRTRVLVYSADNLGERAPADGSVQVGRATLIVGQQTIGPDIVAGPNITMLRITLTPMGGVTSLTALNLTRLGSSADPVNLSLYRDDGSGVLDPADRLLAVAPMAGTAASLTMSESVGAPAVLWVEARWANLTPTSTFGLSIAGVGSNGTVSFRPPETGLVYLGAAPTSLRVDGAFGDWRGRVYGQDALGDVTNRTGGLQYDANVDLLATAVDLASNFTGYVRVDGRLLGGEDIPTTRIRTYPGPPATNVTVAPQPPAEGDDVVDAFIDADNSSGTGMWSDVQGNPYGFDYAIAVIGRNGAVNSSGLYAFAPGSANPWTFVRPVVVALDAHRMEFAVNATALNLTAGYRVVYLASDWRLGYDVALPDAAVARFPVGAQAATNAVINEVSPQPNPEWVEVANPTATSISLNGWDLALNKGGKVTVIFTFTTQSLGAWGSGLEYLSVVLPKNSLPNGNTLLQLRQGNTVVDQTTFSPSVGSSQTWARFKDPITGRPMDTNNDAADFYVSLAPSPARGNDRHRPTISIVKTASRAIAAPGESIAYTLYYNNTDTGMAKTVWINDTLPSGVVFSSSSVPYSYIIGPMYGWAFANVMPGAHSFTVTVQVSATTTNGQVLRNTVTLDYTDQLSRPLTRTRGWANATVWRPTITVVKTANPSNAKAGDLVTFTIYYNNTGSVAAGTVTIKDSLPNGFDYVGASPVPTWMNGRTFYWNFTNVAPGAHSLTMTARVNSTFKGTQLVNWAFLNYTTIGGYPLIGSTSSVTVSIPELSDMIFVAVVPVIILGLKLRAKRRGKE